MVGDMEQLSQLEAVVTENQKEFVKRKDNEKKKQQPKKVTVEGCYAISGVKRDQAFCDKDEYPSCNDKRDMDSSLNIK